MSMKLLAVHEIYWWLSMKFMKFDWWLSMKFIIIPLGILYG